MNLRLLVVCMLSLIGLGCGEPLYPEKIVSGVFSYKLICIDNVEYISGFRNLAPHFKSDGSLYTCE